MLIFLAISDYQLQYWSKYLKHGKEMKQSGVGTEKFDIHFSITGH